MLKEASRDHIIPGTAPQAGESQTDYRQRMALLQAEAVERRRQELGQQCSPLNTPSDRILIWERLHQLPLPSSSGHRLIRVIATDTGLSVDEVRAEQHARIGQRGQKAG